MGTHTIFLFEISGVESLFWAGTCPVPPKRDRGGRGAQYEGNFLSGKPRPVGGELHFAYISRKFLFDPQAFFPGTKKYLHRHPADC